MRRAIFGLFALLPFCALASYELAMYESGGKIMRYDPVNRVSLGSFGDGEIGTYSGFSLALSAARPSDVAVLNPDGGVRWFNYATGTYLGGVNLGWFTGSYQTKLSVLNNGNYLVTYAGTESRIYSATGTLLTTMSPFGTSYQGISHAVDPSGNIHELARFNSDGTYFYYSFKYNSSGNYLGFTSLGTSTDMNLLRYATATSSKVHFSTGSSSAGPYMITTSFSTGGTFTNTDASGYVTGGWSNLAAGHGDRVHGLQTFGNGLGGSDTWYYSYDPIANSWGYRHKMPTTVSNFNAFVMVVAPEPAGGLALAAGAWLLLRRKK